MKNYIFVPYEIAIYLKNKGYNEKCIAYYYPYISGEFIHKIDSIENINKDLNNLTLVKAPTWQQLIDWIYREKNIFIEKEYVGGVERVERYTAVLMDEYYNMTYTRKYLADNLNDAIIDLLQIV